MERTANRLATYRRRAVQYKESHPESVAAHDWHYWMTRKKTKPCPLSRDLEDPKVLYVESLSVLGWRDTGEAGYIIRLRHTGWYADNDQQDTIKGYVLQLPSRNGVEQYVPCTYRSEFDTGTVYLAEIGSDKEQAARWADQNAEREAEKSREFYAKDAAEQQITEAREEIHRINKEALTVLKEIKGQSFTPAVCSMLKGGVAELLADRRAQFKRIVKLQDNFWEAVPQ